MNPIFVIIALTIVTIALVFLVYNRKGDKTRVSRSGKTPTGNLRADRSTTQWRSVKIEPGLICCSAAEILSDKVFLANASPTLPLAECGEAECRCKYIHLKDRRSGEERRLDLGDLGAYLPGRHVERRQHRGRRVSDLAA